MEKTPIIRVKNLYKIYRVGETKVRALNGVEFTLYKGEFCAIVGTSGSGKSTLLNMLAGLEKPTKGEIEIGGKHIEKLSEKELVTFRREKVGFIFQSYNLLNTMNALENVAMPALIAGRKKREAFAEARRLLDDLGLGHRLDHRPSELSGGEKQRAAIARALVNRPRVVFADEPTGSLDSHNRREIQDVIQRLRQELGQTFVVVTHDRDMASIADRTVEMADGRIVSSMEKTTSAEAPEV